MYPVDTMAIARARLTSTSRLAAVSPVVWWLGVTSLFTDVSSEMVYSVLPAYLVLHLGFSPLSFGLIDSSYHGTTALLRVVSALFSDRLRRYKEVAVVGYAVAALAKVGLLAGTAWTTVAASVAGDRLGKGIRTAPRDALITLGSRPSDLGLSFGVHRALDALGAMLGPLAAFALLSLPGGGFDALFLTSLCAALVGLSALVLFVRNPAPAGPAVEPRLPLGLADVFRNRRFALVAVVALLVGVVTLSDGFLYLILQRRLGLPHSWFPLMAFGVAAVYMLTAVPLGRLADRVGRSAVFVGGHLALLLLYAGLLLFPAAGVPLGLLSLALLGLYYAATDGVLVALAASFLERGVLATGLAVVGTITSLSRVVASVTFGAAWSSADETAALTAFALGLLLSTVLAALATRRLHHG